MTITLLFETFSSYTTPSSALYSLQPSFSIHAAVKFYQAFYEPNFFIGVQYLSQQMLRSSCSLFSSPVSLYSFHFIEKGFSFHETRLVLLSIRPPFQSFFMQHATSCNEAKGGGLLTFPLISNICLRLQFTFHNFAITEGIYTQRRVYGKKIITYLFSSSLLITCLVFDDNYNRPPYPPSFLYFRVSPLVKS